MAPGVLFLLPLWVTKPGGSPTLQSTLCLVSEVVAKVVEKVVAKVVAKSQQLLQFPRR